MPVCQTRLIAYTLSNKFSYELVDDEVRFS